MALFKNMLANLGLAGLLANILKTGTAISVCTLLSCSGDSSSGSSVDEQNSDDVSVAETEITGVTQKGPFLMGSKVQMFEISNGHSLNQTGKSFNGKISNDKGEFKINGSKLVSQYVVLEASGYYRNEITGKNSNSELTLLAISDVKDRNTININLLTHLEYERVNYLVTEENAKVDEAKKQAQKEILKIFDIDNKNFSNSEDLNIAGSSDEDGALLAISIMLQGDRSESQLSELLTKIAIDMEEDGEWNDDSKRNEIADWAAEIVQSGRIESIRENIEKWKLSNVVPNFEKYINNFWWNNYGFAACDKDHNGKILQNANKQSEKYQTYYICKDGLWKEASALEFDTYQWASGKDGDDKYGSVNSKNCYVFEDKVWRSGNASDCSLGLRGCTALRQDTVGKGSDKIYHICDEKSWRNATTYEKDTFGWKKTTDGTIKKGNVTDSIYVFDKNTWRATSNVESKLGGCVSAIADSVGKVGSTYYICKSNEWIEASAIESDTYRWKAGKDGDSKYGSVNIMNCYVFEDNVWRSGKNTDCSLGLRGCTALRQDTVGLGSDKNWYKCDSKIWRTATNIEKDTATWGAGKFNGEVRAGQINKTIYYIYETGKKAWRNATTYEKDTYDYKKNKVWDAGTDGEIKKGSVTDSNYVFDAIAWRVADDVENVLGGCVTVIQDSVGKAGNSYYICKPRKWMIATALQYDTYKRDCSQNGKMFSGNVNTTIKYVCDNSMIRAANEFEVEIDSACTSYNRNEYYIPPKIDGKNNYSYYKCTENGWEFTTEKKNKGTVVDENDGSVYKTIGIGTQMWMAEELKKKMTWTEMMKLDDSFAQKTVNGVITYPHQGICMQGWHVPTKKEFETLAWFAWTALHIENIEKVLKSVEDAGTDNLGFSGKAGRIIWTAAEYDKGYILEAELSAHTVDLDNAAPYVSDSFVRGYRKKTASCYVRCIKDDE